MTTIIFSGNDFTFLSDDYGTGLESFLGGCEKSNFLDKTVTFGGQIRFVILEKYFWSTMEKLLLSDPFTHPPSPISQFSL